jgi:RHS repeat-associated protein
MPLTVTRTYRQNDPQTRAFGKGTNWNFGIFLWSALQYQEADLVLPDGGRIHYVRTSSGTSWSDAVFESTATPTMYYKSTIAWNGNGWDLRLRDGTVYIFAENAGLKTIRDRYGNQVNLIRQNGDPNGNVIGLVSSSGRWVTLTYDTSNRITSVTDNTGRTTGYTYNAAGYLETVTDPAGGVTTYTYDTNGRMLTLRDARNIVFLTNHYDANGRVDLQTQADTTTYHFAYTLDGNGAVSQTDVTDPRAFIHRVTFNAAGYSLTDAAAYGTPQAETTTYVRQASGNLSTSVTDALDRRTDSTYDAAGNVTSVTRLAGTGNAVTTQTTYGVFSLPTTITDPLGRTTTFAYDTLGELVRVTDPRGKDTTFTYNSAGQPTTVTDPTGKTTTSLYFFGDPIGTVDPLGKQTRSFIDAAGRPAAMVDPLGATTRTNFDSLNRPTVLTSPLGGTTTFSYDPNGNVLTVTDSNGGVTTETYDNMDRLLTKEDPLHRQESRTYDAAGHIATATDRKGQVTTYTYDPIGRRTFTGYKTVTVGGSTTYESTISAVYDAANRLRGGTDSASGTVTYGYDDFDQLISEVSPQGSVTYAYDAAGRRTSMTLAGQPQVTYTYDAADRLTRVTQGTDVVSVTYDDAGRRLTMTLPNSVVATYAHDDASRVTGITYTRNSTAIGDLSYGYDADGHRTSEGGSLARTILPVALTAATYGASNQLATWDGTSFSYDPNGSLTGQGSAPAPDTQAPTVPTSLSATAIGSRQVNLSWSPSTDNVGVTKYSVFRGGTLLTGLPGGTTTFTDWSVAPSIAYAYTVAASDAGGNSSAQSTAANVTTPAEGTSYASDAFNRTVTGGWGTADVGGAWSGTDSTFSVSPGGGKVTLSSATNKNANLTAVAARDQEVLVKLNVNKLATGGTTTAWVALRRQSSTTYYSAQVAFNTSHTISLSFVRTSNGTSTTIGSGIAAPTHLATDSYWLRVQISGTTATNGKMRLWKVGTTEPTTWTVNSTDNATPTALRGTGHVGVRFQVAGSGFPIVGTFSALAFTSIGGGAPPPDTTAPTVPTGLTATAASSTRINLSWTASTDAVGVQGYRLFRSGSLAATVGSTTWADTGLTPSTAYSYTVAAIDGAGNASAQSTSAGSTTQSAALSTSYVWNARNELTQILDGSTVTAAFAYDASGSRISKTINSTSTAFAYSGPNAIQEKSGGTPSANMLTGGTDELFKRSDSLGARYPLTDAQGSVLALVDSTGATTTSYTYGPFGQTSSSGEASANPTQFTGRENDGTGLYYYRARYYDPIHSRFISEDPAGFAAGGPNLHSYVGDDPTDATDSAGECSDPGGPGIRYCIERFIPEASAMGATGDNRSYQSSGGTYRIHQAVFQRADGTTTYSQDAGVSHIGLVNEKGRLSDCLAVVVSLPLGGRKITVECAGLIGGAGDNPLSPFWWAPTPEIFHLVRITEDATGRVASVVGFGTPYPAMEIWQYGGTKGPQLAFCVDAAGKSPLDLAGTTTYTSSCP